MNNTSVGLYRDALPTHFTFKIQSFSLLTNTSGLDKYESNDFEAGGYKWKLVFYPNGNNTTTSSTTSSTQNGLSSGNHVSMYLKIVDTNSLPRGWIIDVSFRFFVLDQISDKYFILGDMGGTTRRFHEMKTMWGYDQLLPLGTINDSSNGYIIDDVCVFGAEVFPCKNTGCGDCLTMVRYPSSVKYTWKIENFSKKRREEIIYSDEFVSGGYKWKIRLFPKGNSQANKEYISLFFLLSGSTDTVELAGVQVYVRFKYRISDQLNKLHREQPDDKKWFTLSPKGWGRPMFMRLDELNDLSKGYLVNDTCIVEAEVTVLGVAKRLS